MANGKKKWLSHSGIEVLSRCPRCFWLQYKKGIYQPEGIVSRLANRFDTVLKNYFNIYRPLGELPPMMKDKLEGKLESPFKEKYFTEIDQEYGFWGKLDECLVSEKGEYIPVDFKTSSSDPRGRETLAAYQSQVDDYVFLLEQSGKKTPRYGYLIYFFPEDGNKLHDGFPMIIHVSRLVGNPERTKERIKKAIEALKAPLPQPSPNCPFCTWYDNVEKELHPKKEPKNPAKGIIQEKLIME
ncbi:PD-(D/E)XK nuclease family protein [Candidatus Gottesmanbacteria bacterium]|nr:PD-(D/E)XK nuclease family protein [Candidatus Gottesmanbacteria bacterium]